MSMRKNFTIKNSSQGVMKETKSHTKYKYHLRERKGKRKREILPIICCQKWLYLHSSRTKRKVRELWRKSLHPVGTCSSVVCHDIGVPAKLLIICFSAFSSPLPSHFKFWYWIFFSAGLHSTKWMCNDSVKFFILETPFSWNSKTNIKNLQTLKISHKEVIRTTY